MRFKAIPRAVPWLTLLLLSGCASPVRQQVDDVVCEMAAHPLDLRAAEISQAAPSSHAASSLSKTESPAPTAPANKLESLPEPKPVTPPAKPGAAGPVPQKAGFVERLRLPLSLPGGSPELPRLPGKEAPPEERKKALQKLFPPLPSKPSNPVPEPGPFGHPLTLAELQQIAMANNPLIRQAAADVAAAQGAARQAGTYPNPTFGYEGDTVGTSGTAGFQGVFLDQLIKTAGKLKTAEASALMTLANTELALRRAQTDLMAQVRSGYFAVLVAQYAMEVNAGLATHTEAIYEVFLDYALLGLRPPYEAIELRALTLQARTSLVLAENRYRAAWRQLAAALGKQDMLPTELAGNPETAIPRLYFDMVLAHILSSHTDVLTARNAQQKARYDLRTAQVTPIPDLAVHTLVQKDFTMPPFGITHSIAVGMQIPVWDQNRGGIQQAQGALLRATEEEHRVRNDLTTRLADAFERYEDNRLLAEYYRDRIIPDYKKVFNLVLSLFAAQSEKREYDLAFLDIINNQQLYATAVSNYLSTLTAQWTAVVDVASLLQIDDLFLLPGAERPLPLDLPPLPCGHPCNPLPEPAKPEAGCGP
jgi:cobalt-zinc-cadmium efflux system outer membrane protein